MDHTVCFIQFGGTSWTIRIIFLWKIDTLWNTCKCTSMLHTIRNMKKRFLCKWLAHVIKLSGTMEGILDSFLNAIPVHFHKYCVGKNVYRLKSGMISSTDYCAAFCKDRYGLWNTKGRSYEKFIAGGEKILGTYS